MTNLEKLYQSLHGLEELGITLSEEMQQDVVSLEKELIIDDVIPRLTTSIEHIIKQIQCPVSKMIHYEPEELLDIELTQIGTDIRSVQSVAPRITPNKQIREAYGEDEIKLIVDVP